ncbi:MAG: hypothetical protein QOE82_3707 [Thermoanaerobaculia bacterium]|jgi:hypothetical protein|nr:hypothetical protein [Thermoanaerobaculia bacterium]
MRNYVDPELESTLQHVERLLASGKTKAAGLAEGRDITRYVAHDLGTRAKYVRALPPEMRETLQRVIQRTESARTADELRDVIRDLRQYMFAFSSFARAHEVEDRMRDLEAQIQVLSQGGLEHAPVAGPAPVSAEIDKSDAITIESLKQKRVLFTIMPFHSDFDDIWTGGIQRAASGTGLTPVRIDMITKSVEINDDIVRAIQMAEVVVVDVTRNNPNVMFEFGFALALKKPQVVISQSTEFLTFDIKHVRTLMYQNSWKGIEALHRDLQKFIKGAIDGVKKPTRTSTKPARAKAKPAKDAGRERR